MANKKLLSQQKSRRTKEVQDELKEIEMKMDALKPLNESPPEYLSKDAKEEYKRLYPLITELPVKDLDYSLIGVFCQSSADYQNATKELEKGEVVTFTERGSKINPWHRVKVDSFNIMNSLAPKIGLTIDSRMKIFTPKEKEKKSDPFEAMLNGGK